MPRVRQQRQRTGNNPSRNFRDHKAAREQHRPLQAGFVAGVMVMVMLMMMMMVVVAIHVTSLARLIAV